MSSSAELGSSVILRLRKPIFGASPETVVSNHLAARNVLITGEDSARIWAYNPLTRASIGQLIASLTGLPTQPSISTSVSMVNLAVFLFTTSDTRGRETIRISAASACVK